MYYSLRFYAVDVLIGGSVVLHGFATAAVGNALSVQNVPRTSN